ncbi:predicted protein [Nematostella vectensis]|uniref:WD and tetratricopeptide repeats protein 1 n=1 Tax=Nematostella vectensis TaxID=45351 RepID=A7T282_NEMVE|nr:predicted protein [Nematostella vectensis]|eukprot:XP_001622036.1 hypothetical protein NEMVEDRAFT_v1g221254 [Nematostella vectensis]
MEAKNTAILLRNREYHSSLTRNFLRKLHVYPPFVERLGLEKELEGHTGCVNCLELTESGELLASGSDDLNAIIWEPLSYKKKCVIATGHTGNIFSIKFLPCTGDRIIATAAADTKVRIHSVEKNETTQVYHCHIGRVKRLAVAPNMPSLVWSASEDGTIRQFDLRQPHCCNSNSKNCNNVLINLNVHSSALAEPKCIAINPLRPNMMAIGCNDPFVRIYDHRMLAKYNLDIRTSGAQNPEDFTLPEGCVTYFAPGHLPPRLTRDFPKKFRTYVATYVTFSPDGSEVLTNMGGEQVYLFDINHPNKPVSYQRLNGTTNGVIDGMQIHPSGGGTNGYTLNGLNGKTPVHVYKSSPYLKGKGLDLDLPPRALHLKTIGNEAFCKQQFLTAVNMYNEALNLAPNSAVLYANRAAAFIKRSWEGDVYAALRDCHKALTLDPNHTKAHFRQARCLYELRWCQEALSCLNHFKERFPDQAEGSAARSLERDIRAAAFAETQEKEPEEPSEPETSGSTRRRRRLSLISDQEKSLRSTSFDYSQRYCGHCNTTTDIKEANFFGDNGQYIVAGSDDGSFFMWDRNTTNLIRVLKGDDSIVNCLQPHPSVCILATSGIDPVIRLWSPRPVDGSGDTRKVDELEAAARANQRRMNADPLEVMLMNMGYRTRLSVAEGSDDESDEFPMACRPN